MNTQEEKFLVKLTVEVIEMTESIGTAREDKKINVLEWLKIFSEANDVFKLFKDFTGFDLDAVTNDELARVAKLLKAKIDNENVTENKLYFALNWIKFTSLLISEVIKNKD